MDDQNAHLSLTLTANAGHSFTGSPEGYNKTPSFLCEPRSKKRRGLITPAGANYDIHLSQGKSINFTRKKRLDYPLQPKGNDAPGVGRYLELEQTTTIKMPTPAKGRPADFSRRLRSTFFSSSIINYFSSFS